MISNRDRPDTFLIEGLYRMTWIDLTLILFDENVPLLQLLSYNLVM